MENGTFSDVRCYACKPAPWDRIIVEHKMPTSAEMRAQMDAALARGERLGASHDYFTAIIPGTIHQGVILYPMSSYRLDNEPDVNHSHLSGVDDYGAPRKIKPSSNTGAATNERRTTQEPEQRD